MGDLCKRYAMGAKRRAELLALLELRPSDETCATLLYQTVLNPCADEIVDHFYDYLLQHEAYTVLLERDQIAGLKQTQAAYVRSFGMNFSNSDYFEHRLRIGLAHKKVGLSLSLYQCAYRVLQELILTQIPVEFNQQGVMTEDLHRFVHKMTALDMALAIESYHDAAVSDIEEKLQDTHVETALLKKRIETDALTGLSTREYGKKVLEANLSSESDRDKICVLMIDIDFFKKVNDTYGHMAGDAVLQQVAKLLMTAVRDFDVTSRFGGEEFMIILLQVSKEIAIKVAKRIRQLVIEYPVVYQDNKIAVTVSQGIAFASSHASANDLIEDADKALYQAKNQGRDCIVMSGEDVIRG